MSERKKKSGYGKADVVAIVQQGDSLKAVQIGREGRSMSIHWARSSYGGRGALVRFAQECGLSVSAGAAAKKKSGKRSVAGFNSSHVIFYRADMPAVKSQELGAMIRLQAESRLPLPADQMEFAWKVGEIRDGQVGVTIAAAKRDGLEFFVNEVRDFSPSRILLNSEGVVRAWHKYFSGGDETAVILSIGKRGAELCLSQQGQLVNAVSLDIGMDDLCNGDGLGGQVGVRERLVQDMRSVLELFGCNDGGEVPLFVLSDGGSDIEGIVSSLQSSGLNATSVLPDMDKVASDNDFGIREFYEYLVPIGLASIALEGEAETLNVFDGLYQPVGKKVKRHKYRSVVVSSLIAVVMLVLFAAAHIASDVVMEKRLAKIQATPEFQELIVRQKLIRDVARQRPDLLELVKKINSIEGDGVMLHGVEFVRGQPVAIKGQADNYEKVFKFEEKVLATKGIEKSDTPMSMKKDPKGDKFTFTITFNYKGYTKKSSK
jgi:hypothetical protein